MRDSTFQRTTASATPTDSSNGSNQSAVATTRLQMTRRPQAPSHAEEMLGGYRRDDVALLRLEGSLDEAVEESWQRSRRRAVSGRPSQVTAIERVAV